MADTDYTTPIREKWGAALSVSGFQAIPNILLSRQVYLRLSATDLVVLLHLNRYWWSRDRAPYPRPALIAEKMGVHRRTVERSLERMDVLGLIERMKPKPVRSGRQMVRPVSLIPLADKLAALAGRSDPHTPAKDSQDDDCTLTSQSADATSSKLVPF